jgi:NAD-dependent dihydropyrimidine dehydrogenase PreA subunit
MAMHNITIDDSTCISCRICYKACFVDVIRWDETKNKPVAAYPEDCVHCTYCEALCPKKCIKVDIDFKSERMYQSFDQYR